MLTKKPLILGIGEILWDLLPGDKCLGGAAANFIYHVSQLGSRAILLSKVGNDPLGSEILEQCSQLGLDTTHIQIDENHKTGVVDVKIDEDGQPEYDIIENVAWDFIGFKHQLRSLIRHADLLYFGTLAQRSKQSRETIKKIISLADDRTVKMFDVNLRSNYYCPELIKTCLSSADIVKLNEHELKKILRMISPARSNGYSVSDMIDQYEIELLCITMGDHGCELKTPYETVIHRGFDVDVKDAVGAGDAFAAALAANFLAGLDLRKLALRSNLLGSYVASQKGATPHITKRILEQVDIGF